jgi:hypothetical protein
VGEKIGLTAKAGSAAPYFLLQKQRDKAAIDRLSPIGESTVLLEAPLLVAGVFFIKSSHKAKLYPTVCGLNEELQFPLAGKDHIVFLVSGEVEWFDRESPKRILLEENQLLQVTKSDLKKEHLNLKIIGRSPQSVLLWGVIHEISDN